MARRAILIPRIRQIVVRWRPRHAGVKGRSEVSKVPLAVMALQAQREHRGTLQQPRVHRPVRLMAGFAALDRHRTVVEYERPAPPGSFFFKINDRKNMIDAPTARTLKVSMYAKVAACAPML